MKFTKNMYIVNIYTSEWLNSCVDSDHKNDLNKTIYFKMGSLSNGCCTLDLIDSFIVFNIKQVYNFKKDLIKSDNFR